MPSDTEKTVQVCNCLALRQAARHVTQFYDQCLAPTGLRTTQFSILAKLKWLGPMTINALAPRARHGSHDARTDHAAIGTRRPHPHRGREIGSPQQGTAPDQSRCRPASRCGKVVARGADAIRDILWWCARGQATR